jgi:hypothetical protein
MDRRSFVKCTHHLRTIKATTDCTGRTSLGNIDGHDWRCIRLGYAVRVLPRDRNDIGARRCTAATASTTATAASTASRNYDDAREHHPEQQEAQRKLFARPGRTQSSAQYQSRNRQEERIKSHRTRRLGQCSRRRRSCVECQRGRSAAAGHRDWACAPKRTSRPVRHRRRDAAGERDAARVTVDRCHGDRSLGRSSGADAGLRRSTGGK